MLLLFQVFMGKKRKAPLIYFVAPVSFIYLNQTWFTCQEFFAQMQNSWRQDASSEKNPFVHFYSFSIVRRLKPRQFREPKCLLKTCLKLFVLMTVNFICPVSIRLLSLELLSACKLPVQWERLRWHLHLRAEAINCNLGYYENQNLVFCQSLFCLNSCST